MKGILRNDTATGPNQLQTGASTVGGTLGNTVGNTATTGGNLASNVGQTLGNTASNLGQTARDFGQTGSLGGLAKDSASTLGQTVGDTATTSGNLAKNTFGTVGGTFSDTGSTLGAHSSGSLGQGLGSGFERTGGNLQSGYSGSNLQTGYSGSNLQSGYSGSNLQSGYSGSNLQTGYSGSNIKNSGSYTGEYLPGQTTGTWANEIHTAPTVLMEKVERPLIIRETVMPQEKIEVQPIIHREREQLEVHEITQPMHERDIAPTSMRSATLPAQVRTDVRESDANFQTQYRAATTRYSSDVSTMGVQRELVNKAPILEEHISKKILEEVQPILYKETITPTLIEETQPVYERIVEAPIMFEETRQTVDLGTKILSQPVTTQFSSLGLNEPNVIHKETYITKEVFAEPSQKASSVSGTPSKHII